MPKHLCETELCGEEISEGTGTKGGLPICPKCRSVQYYWRKQGPAAFEARREKMTFWTSRFDYLAPHIGRRIKEARAKVRAMREAASAMHH